MTDTSRHSAYFEHSFSDAGCFDSEVSDYLRIGMSDASRKINGMSGIVSDVVPAAKWFAAIAIGAAGRESAGFLRSLRAAVVGVGRGSGPVW